MPLDRRCVVVQLLGTDGRGRWGEVNGAHRVDLDGGLDIGLAVTPFTYSIPIRRMALQVGEEAPTVVLSIDVETLGVVPEPLVVRRVDVGRYDFAEADRTTTIDVDEHGLCADLEGRFRRVAV